MTERNEFGDWVARLFYPNATEEDLNMMAAGIFDHAACAADVTGDLKAESEAKSEANICRAPTKPFECRICGWKGREFELITHPDPIAASTGTVACPDCKNCAGLIINHNAAPSGAQAADRPASAMPPWGNWPGIFGVEPPLPEDEKKGEPGDFGAQVSDALAKQREIGGAPKADAMRVPSFDEREADRARMAEHFRKCGVL